MKKVFAWLLCAAMVLGGVALAQEAETVVVLSDETITVNGEAITESSSAPVYLAEEVQLHEDVPEDLKDLANRVVVVAASGSYRFSGTATDIQIAVRAQQTDTVRLILDNANLTCRTAPAIVVESAADPRTPGQYGVTIELAGDNKVTGSHTVRINDDDVKYDGAIDSLVSLGFEGAGSLTVDADNEGIEVKFGHLTINGGAFHVTSGDDPLNVSEDGVGVLTVNDGYLYTAVKPAQGGEGDGIDSNGYIVFNGGTAINLAHPSSGDSGIDSDMGSSVNGGVIAGAGNMYDPIETSSEQLFMMLEFAESTDQLVVVTDQMDTPVFAYDFPHSYTYIAFSTPELKEGETYRVYLGGEIEGESQDGLYTAITSYVPGQLMQHGEGTANAMGGMMPMGGGMPENMTPPEGFENPFGGVDLNELLKDKDLNELLQDKDLNGLLTGFALTDLFTDEEIKEHFGDVTLPEMPDENRGFGGGRGMGGGFGGGPRSLESSADVATTDFVLTQETSGFTNIRSAQ
ncbi:MAG: carbohydrate-binding domain-containing protein [Clostridia bacterium]|nr:carbohydrate-binding domain-containing protein [Clostridia bacterium]